MHMQCSSQYSFLACALVCLGLLAGSAKSQSLSASQRDVHSALKLSITSPPEASLTSDDLLVTPEVNRKLPPSTRVTKAVSKIKIFPMPGTKLPCPPCPADAPPTNIPWISHEIGWVDIGGGCIVNICYCTRMTSPGNYDFVITQIQVDQSTGCGTLDQMLNTAYQWMRDNNPMEFPCPPCEPPSITNWYREVKGQCWGTYTDPTNGATYYQMCLGGEAWCMTPFRICCDPEGGRHEIQGATVVFGTATCVSPCTQVTCYP
jgi:hypothetical protein